MRSKVLYTFCCLQVPDAGRVPCEERELVSNILSGELCSRSSASQTDLPLWTRLKLYTTPSACVEVFCEERQTQNTKLRVLSMRSTVSLKVNQREAMRLWTVDLAWDCDRVSARSDSGEELWPRAPDAIAEGRYLSRAKLESWQVQKTAKKATPHPCLLLMTI